MSFIPKLAGPSHTNLKPTYRNAILTNLFSSNIPSPIIPVSINWKNTLPDLRFPLIPVEYRVLELHSGRDRGKSEAPLGRPKAIRAHTGHTMWHCWSMKLISRIWLVGMEFLSGAEKQARRERSSKNESNDEMRERIDWGRTEQGGWPLAGIMPASVILWWTIGWQFSSGPINPLSKGLRWGLRATSAIYCALLNAIPTWPHWFVRSLVLV